MAQYNYKVMDKSGKAKKGTVEAVNEDKAKEKLKSEGYIVQEIREQGAGKKAKGKRVKDQDLAVFCKQFGSVLNAGVTMISALEMMADQIESKALQRAVREAQASPDFAFSYRYPYTSDEKTKYMAQKTT